MNKFFNGLAVVAVVLAVVAFFFPIVSPSLGAANVTPSNALDNQALTNELNLIANPLVAIEQTTTAIIAFPSVGTSTPVTTSTVLTLAAQVGDAVLVSPVTTSTPGVVFTATVSVASTTNATFAISAELASGTVAITPGAANFHITVLPFASFAAPTGL